MPHHSKAFWLCTYITIAFVVSSSITTLTLTVTMTPPGPHFYINEFYVPVLDLSQHMASNNNNNIFFDLAFVNILPEQTVHYGDVNITLSHGRNAVANYVVPTFFQEPLDVVYRREVVESRGVPWESTVKAVSNGSTVVFRVDLVALVKFHSLNTKKKDVRIGADVEVDGTGLNTNSKKKDVRIGADVEVDGTGLKLKREDIRLDSAASRRGVLGTLVLFLNLL
ncbi:hypothetical protein MIMGU_mgv1a020909mg, partial [Erythranthe guttata]